MAEEYENYDEALRMAQRLVDRLGRGEGALESIPGMTPHVEDRLRDDIIIWLGSIRPDGRPHLVPVWFLWDGSTILIFSQPNKQKIRNIRGNPNVTLALETGGTGADVIVIEGEARLSDEPIDTAASGYADKYRAAMEEIGYTPETMAQDYSQPIRVTPRRIRAS